MTDESRPGYGSCYSFANIPCAPKQSGDVMLECEKYGVNMEMMMLRLWASTNFSPENKL